MLITIHDAVFGSEVLDGCLMLRRLNRGRIQARPEE